MSGFVGMDAGKLLNLKSRSDSIQTIMGKVYPQWDRGRTATPNVVLFPHTSTNYLRFLLRDNVRYYLVTRKILQVTTSKIIAFHR